MNTIGIVVLSGLAILVGLLVRFFALPVLVRRRISLRRTSREAFSSLDFSVEVDCRACGQFNYLPSFRLLDQPKIDVQACRFAGSLTAGPPLWEQPTAWSSKVVTL